MKKLMYWFVILMCITSSAYAELSRTVIVINTGTDEPINISVVPFHFTESSAPPENVAKIVSSDLRRSGQFNPLAPENMLSFPSLPEDITFRDWRLLGSEYLLIGHIVPEGTGYTLTFSLFDVVSQLPMLSNQVVTVAADGLRDMAHYVSDAVYEKITGIRGVFSTDIIYVEHQKSSGVYRLIRADMDGARPQILLTSKEPLLSPSWSPNGQYVTYVSFETGRPAIFLQHLATGKREQLTRFKGLNSAPTFSPDGESLALVLSKDGNPEIYTLDLKTRSFKRITHHFGIDTEPQWAADSRSIIFTSNRGGKPQIYRVAIDKKSYPQRVTFEGDHNTRAQLTPDGKSIVMVHRDNGKFHIATQELETGIFRILTTETSLDESPSIAPNGASLIYATKKNNKGILASVSLDAGTKFALPSTAGDVREPAWSPFFKESARK